MWGSSCPAQDAFPVHLNQDVKDVQGHTAVHSAGPFQFAAGQLLRPAADHHADGLGHDVARSCRSPGRRPGSSAGPLWSGPSCWWPLCPEVRKGSPAACFRNSRLWDRRSLPGSRSRSPFRLWPRSRAGSRFIPTPSSLSPALYTL